MLPTGATPPARTAPSPELLLTSAPLQSGGLPGGVCPSLSTLTLGTYLRGHGVAVEVFDPSVEVTDPASLDGIAEAIVARQPRLVGITALSPVEGRFGAALSVRLKARRPDLPVVMGGIWAMARARPLLERCPSVDAVVVGPGERSALALARHGLSRPQEVPGLVWRGAAGFEEVPPDRETPPSAPLAMDLLARPQRYDIFCWTTSRGCPYDCDFCTERLGSPVFCDDHMDKVRADLQAIGAARGRWYLWICDPLFGANRKRLVATCEALRETGAKFLAESRVDVLHPEDIPRMADAGCNLIYFGLESASHRSLISLGKLDARPARFRRYREGAIALVDACLRHDILPVMGVLNPVPGDVHADLAETLAFCGELASLRRNGELGPYFHAFPLRLDPGAPFESRLDDLAGRGVEWSTPPDPLFGDRFLVRASRTVGPEEGERFRAAIRGLNPTSPTVTRRLLRSFPRPYVETDA